MAYVLPLTSVSIGASLVLEQPHAVDDRGSASH